MLKCKNLWVREAIWMNFFTNQKIGIQKSNWSQKFHEFTLFFQTQLQISEDYNKRAKGISKVRGVSLGRDEKNSN